MTVTNSGPMEMSFSHLSQEVWPSCFRSIEVIQGFLSPEGHFWFSLTSLSFRVFSFCPPDVWNSHCHLRSYFLKMRRFLFAFLFPEDEEGGSLNALLSNSGIFFYDLFVNIICSFLQWNHLTSCCQLLNGLLYIGINCKYIMCVYSLHPVFFTV
jgi:hypothetical protein